MFSSSFCFFCLARCSFRLFPTSVEMPFEAYIVYSDVTLPYNGNKRKRLHTRQNKVDPQGTSPTAGVIEC